MAFPTSPSTNDTHTYGGTKYKWNGTAWQLFDGSGIGALSQSIATSVVGKKYKISFTISNYNSGNIRMYYGGQFTSFVTSNGVHNLVRFWLGESGFNKFLVNFKNGTT